MSRAKLHTTDIGKIQMTSIGSISPDAIEEIAPTSLRLLPALQQYFAGQIEARIPGWIFPCYSRSGLRTRRMKSNDAFLICTSGPCAKFGNRSLRIEEAAALWESLTMGASVKATLKFVIGNLEAGTFIKDVLESWLRKQVSG